MSDICTESDKVLWTHWRSLASAVDGLASTLNTPGYTNLVSDDTMPFIMADLPSVDFVIEFTLTPGTETCTNSDDSVPYDNEAAACPTISSIDLLTTFRRGGQGGLEIDFSSEVFNGISSPHSFLKDYADNGKLFFVHEEDDCLCKTIFKIEPSDTDHYTLVEVGGSDPLFGCCQTLYVPGVGDALDTSQSIIPAAFACGWGDRNGAGLDNPGFPYDDPSYCPECEAVGSECSDTAADDLIEYDFVSVTNPDGGGLDNVMVLSHAARHMRGHLTWPILEEHMDALRTKLEYIFNPSRHEGLKPASATAPSDVSQGEPNSSDVTMWKHDSSYGGDGGLVHTGDWAIPGSSCYPSSLDSFLAGLRLEFDDFSQGLMDSTQKGTLVHPAGSSTNADVSDDSAVMRKPWEELTGTGSANCGATGRPNVYCETINRLNELITVIGQRLWPNGTAFDYPNAVTCVDLYCCTAENFYDVTCTPVDSLEECDAMEGTLVENCEEDCVDGDPPGEYCCYYDENDVIILCQEEVWDSCLINGGVIVDSCPDPDPPTACCLTDVPPQDSTACCVTGIPDQPTTACCLTGIPDQLPTACCVTGIPDETPAACCLESIPDQEPTACCVTGIPDETPTACCLTSIPDENPTACCVTGIPDEMSGACCLEGGTLCVVYGGSWGEIPINNESDCISNGGSPVMDCPGGSCGDTPLTGGDECIMFGASATLGQLAGTTISDCAACTGVAYGTGTCVMDCPGGSCGDTPLTGGDECIMFGASATLGQLAGTTISDCAACTGVTYGTGTCVMDCPGGSCGPTPIAGGDECVSFGSSATLGQLAGTTISDCAACTGVAYGTGTCVMDCPGGSCGPTPIAGGDECVSFGSSATLGQLAGTTISDCAACTGVAYGTGTCVMDCPGGSCGDTPLTGGDECIMFGASATLGQLAGTTISDCSACTGVTYGTGTCVVDCPGGSCGPSPQTGGDECVSFGASATVGALAGTTISDCSACTGVTYGTGTCVVDCPGGSCGPTPLAGGDECVVFGASATVGALAGTYIGNCDDCTTALDYGTGTCVVGCVGSECGYPPQPGGDECVYFGGVVTVGALIGTSVSDCYSCEALIYGSPVCVVGCVEIEPGYIQCGPPATDYNCGNLTPGSDYTIHGYEPHTTPTTVGGGDCCVQHAVFINGSGECEYVSEISSLVSPFLPGATVTNVHPSDSTTTAIFAGPICWEQKAAVLNASECLNQGRFLWSFETIDDEEYLKIEPASGAP
jgi:hypothetical protein